MIDTRKASRASLTEWSAATAQQLLTRHGVVTRETVASEGVPGGFSAVYDVLKTMEESGRIRRGYFVGGLGGAQFALPPAVDMLRSFRDVPDTSRHVVVAATDPANPYGATLPWPSRQDNRQAGRFAGAQVVIVDGELAAYFSRSESSVITFFDAESPLAERFAGGVVRALAGVVTSGLRRALLITEVDGVPPGQSVLAAALRSAGFREGTRGWQWRKEAAD